jgi:hypothetical protein
MCRDSDLTLIVWGYARSWENPKPVSRRNPAPSLANVQSDDKKPLKDTFIRVLELMDAMQKEQEQALAARTRRKKPANGFCRATILASETAMNPFKQGREPGPSHLILGVGENRTYLDAYHVASLAAIGNGIDDFDRIERVYDTASGGMKAAMTILHLYGLIEVKRDGQGGRTKVGMDCPYRLTKAGESAVRILQERELFFSECTAWLHENGSMSASPR